MIIFLANFEKKLLSEGLSQKSVSVYVDRLKICLNELLKKGMIKNNSFAGFSKMKVKEKEKVWLTIEEIQKLAENITKNLDIAYGFLFACFTGLRYSDIINLKWSQILKDRIVYTAQKTKKSDYIPISETAFQILEKQKSNGHETVFAFFSNHQCNDFLKTWAKKAGINKHITFHTSRHTFITLIIEKSGGDIFTASHLAGHSNVETTQIYAHLNDKTRFDVIGLLPKINV